MTTGNATKGPIRPTAQGARGGAGRTSALENKIFPAGVCFTLGAGVCLLVSLTGCVGDMPHRGAWGAVPESRQVRAATIRADDYVYYPRYAIYFNLTQHRYVCLEQGGWATRSEPADVAMDVLLDSPSVPMAFHDAPELHHESVIRRYPKNWTGSGAAVVAKLEN